MKLSIRQMQINDINSVAEIAQQTGLTTWTKQSLMDCLQFDYQNFILTQDAADKTFFGFAIVLPQIDEAELLCIAIAPSFQNQGFGKQLLFMILEELKAQDRKKLHLEVRRSNAKAIALYRSLGFKEVGWRENYYPTDDGREDALLLTRPL